MVYAVLGNKERVSYVGSDHLAVRVGAYVVFSLILVPCLVRCIKNIKSGEAVPFDDDFLPRKVEFEKKAKKKKGAGK